MAPDWGLQRRGSGRGRGIRGRGRGRGRGGIFQTSPDVYVDDSPAESPNNDAEPDIVPHFPQKEPKEPFAELKDSLPFLVVKKAKEKKKKGTAAVPPAPPAIPPALPKKDFSDHMMKPHTEAEAMADLRYVLPNFTVKEVKERKKRDPLVISATSSAPSKQSGFEQPTQGMTEPEANGEPLRSIKETAMNCLDRRETEGRSAIVSSPPAPPKPIPSGEAPQETTIPELSQHSQNSEVEASGAKEKPGLNITPLSFSGPLTPSPELSPRLDIEPATMGVAEPPSAAAAFESKGREQHLSAANSSNSHAHSKETLPGQRPQAEARKDSTRAVADMMTQEMEHKIQHISNGSLSASSTPSKQTSRMLASASPVLVALGPIAGEKLRPASIADLKDALPNTLPDVLPDEAVGEGKVQDPISTASTPTSANEPTSGSSLRTEVKPDSQSTPDPASTGDEELQLEPAASEQPPEADAGTESFPQLSRVAARVLQPSPPTSLPTPPTSPSPIPSPDQVFQLLALPRPIRIIILHRLFSSITSREFLTLRHIQTLPWIFSASKQLFEECRSIWLQMDLRIDAPLPMNTDLQTVRCKNGIRAIWGDKIGELTLAVTVAKEVEVGKTSELGLGIPGCHAGSRVLRLQIQNDEVVGLSTITATQLALALKDTTPPSGSEKIAIAPVLHANLFGWTRLAQRSMDVLTIDISGAEVWFQHNSEWAAPIAGYRALPLIALLASIIATRPRLISKIMFQGMGMFRMVFRRMWNEMPDRTPILGKNMLLDMLCMYPFADEGLSNISEGYVEQDGSFAWRAREGNVFGVRTQVQWHTEIMRARHGINSPTWVFLP
ncbi:hypothetical protein BDV96DRAFT_593633 [Lophiotrema nucula]|uniref:Uncharacterized protein n=1 Tax=Lophiotrema nucula TaxID=690887 RepID=A0A6A5ZY04_9PLEO|nr:hypothetical protein BDV96DRAFT_593633 [Lophiotrema nucula]